jgi:prevent-host-death family protein
MTISVGIREMTRRTSQVIHQAAAGETVLITEHGQPIAMVVPLPKSGSEAVDRLVREGRLIPPTNPAGVEAALAIEPVSTGLDVDSAQIVSELREERL